MDVPALIDFPVFNSGHAGRLSFAEAGDLLPFPIKRVYWIYEAESDTLRGDHAHRTGTQVLIAFGGSIAIELINRQGEKSHFRLDRPDRGLLIPCDYWRKVVMSKNSVLLSFASESYDPRNYITDYDVFINAL